MKIIDKSNRTTKFCDVNYGDIFKYYTYVYMKVSNDENFNCVDLASGTLKYCFSDAQVQLIENPVLTLK